MFIEEDFYSAISAKTTWSTKNLVMELFKQVDKIEDSNTAKVYAQALENFSDYAKANNITSIGRNQFYSWFKPEVGKLSHMARHETIHETIKPVQVATSALDYHFSSYEELLHENDQLKRLLKQAMSQTTILLRTTQALASALGMQSK